MELANINWLAVIVAGIAAWVIGALWYSPVLFGKIWQKEMGFSDEYLKQANMVLIFGGSLILMLLMSFGMAFLVQAHGETETSLAKGMWYGLFIGVLFVATSIGINYLYQRRSIRLWLIDALYQVIFLVVMGIILGAWS
jgi:hypothetical protein